MEKNNKFKYHYKWKKEKEGFEANVVCWVIIGDNNEENILDLSLVSIKKIFQGHYLCKPIVKYALNETIKKIQEHNNNIIIGCVEVQSEKPEIAKKCYDNSFRELGFKKILEESWNEGDDINVDYIMEYKLDRFLNQDIKKPHLGDQYFKGGRKKKTRRKPIRINPKMRGVFTKKAKKKGMSVQRYANYVIKKYKGKKKTKKQLKLLRQAVFAKTAKKWKKRKKKRGGGLPQELRKIWKNEQHKKKRKRGNKDMNTKKLMEVMNSPVKKRIKKTNEEIERGREEWIKKKLQDDIHQFVELFKKQFGQTTKADIILYDIQRRKSLKRKQEHPNYKQYIEDYIKNANDASTKIKFINTFINIFNKRLNRKRLSELYDEDPELERKFFEKFDAMSRTPSGRWDKKDSIIYDGNLGRNSPLEFITDSQPVSLNMTKRDDNYFFNRPG